MSVKLLIDMNLSPAWVTLLKQHGYDAVHWSAVGDSRASDATIMAWAVTNGYTVFTHDLDFGTLLALTHERGPSVLQVRTQDVLPDQIGDVVLAALRQHESELLSGALVVVEPSRFRVRVLPI
jgi:predicted nuclease of predicted toxin-antitoxin system